MKRTAWIWQLMGFAVTALGGTLLHFLYDWTDEAIWIAPFSGVNESTWEHMKLLFWPMLIYALIQYVFFREYESFWCIKAKGISLGLVMIPILFYTYNGAVGKSPDWLNITIFFICAAVAYLYELRLFNLERVRCRSQRLSIALICIIAILFIIFTYRTPEIGIFKDPIDGTYGI